MCQFGKCSDKTTVWVFLMTVLMAPAYLQKSYKVLSYFSGAFTAFSVAACVIVITYSCILISDNRRMDFQ